jgi:hypothetical protein
MITQVSGMAVRCNLCAKNGPIIRYDRARYRHVPGVPDHPNEAYIIGIEAQAEKEALSEGFVALINEQQQHVAPGFAEEDDGPQDALIDNNQALRSKHICPACLESLSECIIKVKEQKKYSK